MPSIDQRWWALLVVVFGSLALSSGHFENPDAHLRLSQAFSLLEGRGFELGDGVGNPLHGNIAIAPDGRRFSVYNPGQIILFVPAAIVGEWSATSLGLHPHYAAELWASFLGVVFHFLTGVMVYSVARRTNRSRQSSMFCALVFAFATFNLPSSRDGYEHAYEALAVLSSIWVALGCQDSTTARDWRALSAGVVLGVGLLFRNTAILGLPAVLIVLSSMRTRIIAVVGMLPALAVIAFYNWSRFGSPIETGYRQAWHAANPALLSESGFSLSSLPMNAAQLWVSPGKGMLWFSPVLLLALVGAKASARSQPRLFAAVATSCAAYTALYAANFAWHGSAWCWGPRYLIPLTPLLVLLLPWRRTRFGARLVTIFLAAGSTVLQTMAILVNYKRHLLELLIEMPTAFRSGAVFSEVRLSPVVALPRQLVHQFHVLNDSAPLYLFHGAGRWRNESRPVGISTMLEESIDLNAIDLWWIRFLYFPISEEGRLLVLGCGLMATTGLLIAVSRVYDVRAPR